MLSIYDNLRMINATSTYKDTTLIKNEEGEPHYKVTTIVMTEKLCKQADNTKTIKGTFEIKNKKWEITHKYGDNKKNTTETIEYRSSKKGQIINVITMKDPLNEKENKSMEQLVERIKSNKPRIKEIKIIQEARELRSSKRKRSSDSREEKEKNKIRKTSHRALKSRQNGLAGDV